MDPQPSEIARSLSRKYKALYDAFNALAVEAAQFHNSLPLTDKTEHGLFNSMSRIVAFSDHIHVALKLMAEDVQAIKTTHGDREAFEWADPEDCFDEWFTALSTANTKVH